MTRRSPMRANQTVAALLLAIIPVVSASDEDDLERASDYICASGYIVLGVTTAYCWWKSLYVGPIPPIKRLFWSLVLITCLLRSVWFMIPERMFHLTYRPQLDEHPSENHPYSRFAEMCLRLGADTTYLLGLAIIVYFWASTFYAFWRTQNLIPSYGGSFMEYSNRDYNPTRRAKMVFGMAATVMCASTCFVLAMFWFVPTSTLLVLSSAVSAVFSIIAAFAFMYYGTRLWNSLRPLRVSEGYGTVTYASDPVPILQNKHTSSESNRVSDSFPIHVESLSVSPSEGREQPLLSATDDQQFVNSPAQVLPASGVGPAEASDAESDVDIRLKMTRVRLVAVIATFSFFLRTVLKLYELRVAAGKGRGTMHFPPSWWVLIMVYYILGEVVVSFLVVIILKNPTHQNSGHDDAPERSSSGSVNRQLI